MLLNAENLNLKLEECTDIQHILGWVKTVQRPLENFSLFIVKWVTIRFIVSEMLLESGAELNLLDHGRNTALHHACQHVCITFTLVVCWLFTSHTTGLYILWLVYLGFYVTFNTVQVISRRVVGRAEETSTYSWPRFCTVNSRPTASNYQFSHLRPCLEPNPGLRGGRRECYRRGPCSVVGWWLLGGGTASKDASYLPRFDVSITGGINFQL